MQPSSKNKGDDKLEMCMAKSLKSEAIVTGIYVCAESLFRDSSV